MPPRLPNSLSNSRVTVTCYQSLSFHTDKSRGQFSSTLAATPDTAGHSVFLEILSLQICGFFSFLSTSLPTLPASFLAFPSSSQRLSNHSAPLLPPDDILSIALSNIYEPVTPRCVPPSLNFHLSYNYPVNISLLSNQFIYLASLFQLVVLNTS